MNMTQRKSPSHVVTGRRSSRQTPEKSEGGSQTEGHDAGSPSEAHVYLSRGNRSSSSDTAYRHCCPRLSPFTTAVTLGALLVGAAAASSGSRNPPPPPPPPPAVGNQYNNNNVRQQDRWVGWTPPPPGPPPDPAAGGSGLEAGMAWGAGARESSPQRGAASQQQGAGAVCENDGGSPDSGTGMMGHPQQHHDAAAEARETQQQVQERLSVMGRQQQGLQGPPPPPVNSQQQPQQFSLQRGQQHQQHQHQQPPPHPWGQNGVQQHEGQQDQPYDGAFSNGHNARGRPGFAPPANGGMFQQPPAAGMGVLGGAGAGANGGGGGATGGGDGGGQWEPPSAASAGAVTPEVKLSQYRTAAGAGGDSGGEQEQEKIARALLTNTDKEVIFDGLKKLYRKKILPLEESSRYAHFHSPPMNPADFEAKPMVLIVGQYSVGKTSFIRSLLKRDFPGQRVGPEPTTDRFVAVTHGEDERVMPGHALAMQTDKPFRSLQQFGNNFLTKFEGSVVDAPILRNITLVDTPGVLSGEKQRIGRDYDFASVISWFAERADLIVVMFDAHKLDISDELKMVIDTLKPHHDKMRVLLNKADTIDTQQLMRVYGALMWSLGKVMQTPEVCRVYIGSFWEAPLSNFENRFLLEKEKTDLLEELMLLPENAVVRRINELVKRARSVKVHAYIIHYLRKQMPYMMGKQEKQEKLIRRLDQEFLACARRYGLPLGDFPKVEKFRRSLREIKDISRFKSLDKSLVHEMDKVFSGDIPKLMEKAARPGNR
eukprot:g7356.t1